MIIKNIILFPLILLSLTATSQTDKGKQDKWKIGLTMSPDIFLNSTSLTYGYSSDGYNLKPTGFNYTIGVIGQLIIRPKLAIGAGISYSQKNFLGNYYCHVCDFWAGDAHELMKQRFIEIPLFVRYNIVDKKFGFHVETGFINGFLANDIMPKFDGVYFFIDSLSFRKFLLSAQFGIGVDLDLGKRINISLTNTYRHSLTNFSDSGNFKFRSFGFVSGVVYRIKNNKNGG